MRGCRDLTPTAVANYPGSGRAEDFAGFLRNELVPYVDATYRTRPRADERCLMGHSLAGLFTWYAALGLNDRDEWVDRLRSRGYPRLRLQTATYQGIEHNQSSRPAFREGLTELF